MNRRYRTSAAAFLSLAIFAFAVPTLTAQEAVPPKDADLAQVASFVLDHAAALPGNRLAVLPFTYLDGSFSVEGRLASDLLFMDLARSGKVELLERERLAQIVAEHGLAEKGLLDPADAPELGHLLGVNGFLFGSVADLGHKLQLTLRLVDTESRVVAQDIFLLDKQIKTPATPLWEDIETIKQKNEEQFQIEVWTDQTTYAVGDAVTIKFRADRDCYVTVFNMGTSGQITVLFPNRFYATNYVRKDDVYSIPGRFQNFTIAVKGPPGIEKLKIFATQANVPLLPEQYNVSAFRSLDPETDRAVTRDLAVILTHLDATAWAEGRFEFEVKE
jgi:TolB-like protein